MRDKGFLKRVFLAIGCILCLSYFCWFNLGNIKDVVAVEQMSFYEFESQIIEMVEKDNYDGIDIEENITFNALINALGVEAEFMTSASDVDSGALTYDEIDEVCCEFGYGLYESDNGYTAYSTFMLKRLIVTGNVTNHYGASQVVSGYRDYTILCYDTEEQTEYAYNQLIQDTNLNVAIDMVVSAQSNDNDIKEVDELNLMATSHNSWGAEAIGVDEYIDYLGTISQEVVVVVIDSGINTSHTMFSNRFLYSGGNIVGYSYYNGDSLVLGEGYANTQYNNGYSSVAYFEDDDGHGTHVAGIVCDLTPSNVKILPIRALNNEGSGCTLATEAALWRVYEVYSNQYKIASINISIGMNIGMGTTEDRIINLNNQITPVINNLLTDKNILTVVAAGNRSTGETTGKNHVSYNRAWLAGCENAVTVTALKQSNGSCEFDMSYSHYGTTLATSTVNIAAPGTQVLSAYVGSSTKMAYSSGTSMASPHVAAVVALLCLDNRYWSGGVSNYTATQIRTRLYDLAIDMGSSGYDIYYGEGMVSLENFNGGISFTASDKVYTYDGGYHNIAVNVTGLGTYSIKYKTDNVGTYYSSISNSAFNNAFKNVTSGQMRVHFVISTTEIGYGDSYGTAYLTINPRPITVTIASKSSVYGSTIVTLTSSITSGTLVTGESFSDLKITLSTTATSSSGVRNSGYPITGTYNNSNYSVRFVSGTYTITAKPITVTIGQGSSKYGNNIDLNSITSTCSTLVAGDSISDLNIQYIVTGVNASSPAKTYTNAINATCSNSNYIATFVKGDYVVTPRQLQIITTQSSVYGDNVAVDSEIYTLTGDSVVNGDDLGIVLSISGLNNRSSANTYTDKIDMSYTNTNYNITIGSLIYKITKRPITIMVSDRELEYGDEVVDNDTLYTTNGNEVTGDDLQINLTVNISSRIISGTCLNSNYSPTFVSGRLTISPRKISISTYQKGEYCEDIELNNLDCVLVSGSLAYEDTVADLQLIYSTLATKISDIGTYPISLDSYNNNYNITLTSGVYEIFTRKIEVVIDNQSGTYGENIKTLTYKIYDSGNLVNVNMLLNFDITLSCPATAQSDCGTYDIIAVNNDTDRYEITFTNATYTVSKRNLVISIDNVSSQYGYDLNLLTYQITGGQLASHNTLQDLNIVLTTTATNTSIVNTYPITGTYNNDNYDITFDDGVYTIARRDITIRIEQGSEYGKEIVLDNSRYDIDSGSLADFDKDLGITFTTEATSSHPYGAYPIYMTYTNTNYNVTLSSGVYRIVGKIIVITIGNKSTIYGDEISVDDVECYVIGNVVSLEELQVELRTDALSEKLVGEYDITAVCNNDNYSISFTPGKYTITKRAITVKTNQSGMYGTSPTLNTAYDVVEGDIVAGDVVDIEFSTTADISSEVSTDPYTMTIASCSNSNYEVSVSDDSGYIVTARPITIRIGSRNSQYGDEIIQNNTNYEVISTNQIVGTDNLNIVLTIKLPTANAYGHYNVGNYYIEGTYNNKNYNVTFKNGIYSISRRSITLTLDGARGEYGSLSTIDAPSGTITPSMPSGESIESLNLTLSIDSKITNQTSVGVYNDVISATYNNKNYNVTIVKASYEIIARPIKITTTQYGDYGKSPQISNTNFVITEGSVVDGDNNNLGLNFVAENVTINSPVHTYDIKLVSYSNKNYDIELIEGKYIIQPRAITIQLHNASSVYGEDLSQLTYDLKYGFVLASNDTLADLNIEVLTTATSLSGVVAGGYPITANYSNNNYIITFENATYTIEPKQINITINDATSIYGETVSSLSYQLEDGSALVGEDSLQDLNIEISTNVSEISGVLDGGYPITATYDSDNYIINFTNGRYYITPREVHITIYKTGEYGNVPTLRDVEYSVVSGQIKSGDNIDLNLKIEDGYLSGVGNYGITLQGYTNRNYNLILDSGIYEVVAKNITIKVNDVSSQYGYELSQLSYELKSGFELVGDDNLDELNIVLDTPASSLSEVKSEGYPITASYNNQNYDITFENGVYNILPRYVVVKINNATSVYSQSLSALSCALQLGYTLAQNESLEILNINLSTTATTSSAVKSGGYPITGTYNNKNYQIDFINGVYTITPLEVVVKIDNQSGIYGNPINLNNALYEIISPNNVSKETLQVVLATNAMNNSPVGDYNINAFTNNRNYKIISQEGTFTINKRKVTIRLNNQEVKRFFEYKLDNNKYEIVDGYVVEGDSFDIDLNTKAKWYSCIGEYDLSGVCNNANYDVEIIDAKVKVKISTTDIVAVIVALALLIFIIVKIVLKIVRKNKKSQEYIEIYNYWINRK